MRALPLDDAASSTHAELQALFVLNSLAVGGSETKIVRVVNALLRRRMVAGIAYLNGPDDLLSALSADVPVRRLERRGKFSASALRELRMLIQERRPQVVLSVNMYPALYVALATAGMDRRPRTIGLLNTTVLKDGDRWRQSFYRPFLRRLDGFVYGCELQRASWSPELRCEQSRSTVIYNGVDTDYFSPQPETQRLAERRRLGIAARAFVIGSVGRLAPEKNHKALIGAVAELRRRSIDAHLLLVGEGELRAQLEQQAAQLQLREHVTFAGLQRDVRPAVSMADVFVLPSTHVETFSNAALEAMAMGKPVILSRIGGAAEMIRDGVEGFTVEVAELDEQLPSLLSRLHADVALRDRMGRAAWERVRRQFSLQAMVEGYASLIDASRIRPLGMASPS